MTPDSDDSNLKSSPPPSAVAVTSTDGADGLQKRCHSTNCPADAALEETDSHMRTAAAGNPPREDGGTVPRSAILRWEHVRR